MTMYNGLKHTKRIELLFENLGYAKENAEWRQSLRYGDLVSSPLI